MAEGVEQQTGRSNATNLALGVSIGAAVLWVMAFLLAGDDDAGLGFLWPLAGVVGAAGAVLGFRAGRRGRALAAIVLGGLVFLAIAGYVVLDTVVGIE